MMNRLQVFALSLAFALVGLSGPRALANDEANIMGYESIVEQLNREADRPSSRAKLANQGPNALDTIWFHAGVGVSMLMQPITYEDGTSDFIDQRGVQIAGAIDLFSPNWKAEGTMRNFGEGESSRTRVTLKEFELKLVYHRPFAPRLGFHVGGGLTARYMTVSRPSMGTRDYVTPTTVGAAGLDYFITERVSIGIEAAGRSAMTTDTVDHGSYDATVRVDMQL